MTADDVRPELPIFEGDLIDPRLIDSGGDGAVFSCSHAAYGKVAYKRFADHSRIRNEIMNMRTFAHPNIVQFFKAVVGESALPVGFIMDFMDGGSLGRLIHSDLSYPPSLPFHWSEQAASALQFLHMNNIIHRDVKPDNMLISRDRTKLKLCDMARSMEPSTTMTANGTYAYMAPEVVAVEEPAWDYAADVYSLAISIWEMKTRKRPWDNYSFFRLVAPLQGGERPSLDNIDNQDLKDIIQCSWAQDPRHRPTISEVLLFFQTANVNHPIEIEQKIDISIPAMDIVPATPIKTQEWVYKVERELQRQHENFNDPEGVVQRFKKNSIRFFKKM